MWNMGDPPTVFSSTGSELVPPPLAYQYPLPTSGLDTPSNIIPGFHHLPVGIPESESSSQAKPLPSLIKNRGNSISSKSAKVKRSLSTPNVRGQATADAAAIALSAEKRRNKLGYHRTSVACGHCRRRKIRCIPAPADPQQRCSNCIRLKKECNFFPVDQQPPDTRQRDSKDRSGTGQASESSSPSNASVQLPEMQPNVPYPHLSMPSIQDVGGPQTKRQRTESFSPETKVITSSRTFDYSHGSTNWMAPDASPNTKSQIDVPPNYWRVNPQDSPVTPAFSPFTPTLHVPPGQNWQAHHAAPSPREDLSWSVPQRSVSYSNIEGLQSHQYTPFPQATTHSITDNYTTKPRVMQSGMYPPPILTSTSTVLGAETSSASSNDMPQHPTSTMPPASFASWQQPYTYQKPAGSSSETYGGWNSNTGAPHFPDDGHAGPTSYGYGEPGMYYTAPPHPGR